MTQEEIIRMAREAGFEVVDGELRLYFDGSKALLKPNYMGTVVDGLKEFAALVAAHERNRLAWTQEHWTEYEHAIAKAEREACAKVCDEVKLRYQRADYYNREAGANECAAAIRARGEK